MVASAPSAYKARPSDNADKADRFTLGDGDQRDVFFFAQQGVAQAGGSLRIEVKGLHA
jgi:hypothetical protein